MADDNHEIGRFRFKFITPNKKGERVCTVTMKIDENGILNVKARDTRGQNTANLIFTAEHMNLPEEEILRLKNADN